MIDLLSFAQSGGDDEAMGVAVSLDLVRGDQNHIHCLSSPMQIQVDIADKTASVKFPALDHQKVQIAVRSHLASDSRAKEDDLVRLGHFHNTANDFRQHLRTHRSYFAFSSLYHHCAFSSSNIAPRPAPTTEGSVLQRPDVVIVGTFARWNVERIMSSIPNDLRNRERPRRSVLGSGTR